MAEVTSASSVKGRSKGSAWLNSRLFDHISSIHVCIYGVVYEIDDVHPWISS